MVFHGIWYIRRFEVSERFRTIVDGITDLVDTSGVQRCCDGTQHVVVSVSSWGATPSQHPFLDGIFLHKNKNHPFFGYPHGYGNPHVPFGTQTWPEISQLNEGLKGKIIKRKNQTQVRTKTIGKKITYVLCTCRLSWIHIIPQISPEFGMNHSCFMDKHH